MFKQRNQTKPRKEEGRGLACIEDSVDALMQWLEDHIENHEGGLIKPSEIILTIMRKQKWEEKQLYVCFKWLINNISLEKTWTWKKKGNFYRETESLLIAVQNNIIRTNHMKVRIDKMQQNSKCRLCGDRDKTINHIMSECSKLAQNEYKTKHDWVGKMIHWEMGKKFKFDHTNKWYLHNPASVLENDTHKLLWDFDIQLDHLILARSPDLIIINKKKENLQNCQLCCTSWPQNKTEKSEKKDKYLDLARELRKLWNMKVTITPILIGAFSSVSTGLLKGLEDLEVGGWVETIQTTALLRMTKILRRDLETWGDLLSLKLQ